MVPSWPYQLVAVEATTIDCASIILPITPPDEFAAAIRIGDRPNCSEVIFCRLPNSTLEAESEPASATPSQPRSVPKKGYSTPVAAKARPSVASTPDRRVKVPIASIAEIVISEIAQILMVRPYSAIILTGENRRDQHARAGERQIGEPEHGSFRRRLRRHRRHLVDHVVQFGNRIIPGEDRVRPGLEGPVAPDQHNDADDDPWKQRAPKLGLGQRRLVHRRDGLHRRSRL